MKTIKMLALSLFLLMIVTAGASTGEAKSVNSMSAYKSCQTVEKVNGKVYKDVYYMYSVKGASYWLDTASEVENVIKVSDKQLKTWNVNKNKLHHGNKFGGQFTPDGWTLTKLTQR